MPARIPTRLALALATFAIAGPVRADAPGDEAPPRVVSRRAPPLHAEPPPYRPRHVVRREGYVHGRAPYLVERGPIIRAYLPRNPNVPMYNEPPPY